MCIIHKGLSGMRSIFSRFNLGKCGYERSPQSLTKSYTQLVANAKNQNENNHLDNWIYSYAWDNGM